MRLSALLGTRVRTESGRSVGRVYDVRAELRPRSLQVTGLVVGRRGLLERLGIGASRARGRLDTRDVVAWQDVLRADRREVVIRDRSEPR